MQRTQKNDTIQKKRSFAGSLHVFLFGVKHWPLKLAASLVFPALILLFSPLGMTARQSFIVASLLLTIIWWTTNIIKKIPASLFLLTVFCFASGVPPKAVLSFTLSETFFLIAVCYLLSNGIIKSGLVEKGVKPLLMHFAVTPLRLIFSMLAVFIAAIYIIPQPLARLLIIAGLFGGFLNDSGIKQGAKDALMLACVFCYILVGMTFKSADIIINTAVLAFAGLDVSEAQWFKYMAAPTAATAVLIGLVFFVLFKSDLRALKIKKETSGEPRKPLTGREKTTLLIVCATALLWMTSSLHGLAPVWIAALATICLFAIKVLEPRDIAKVDFATLVFLAAAFSIGGVLKGCGAADIIFSRLDVLLPKQFSPLYAVSLITIAMAMHMILGSNTTTCSIVIPGLLVITAGTLPALIVVFIVYNSMIYHALLPFHSVSIMVSAGNGYFPSGYVAKMGIPLTAVVFISILCFYLPWWTWLGYV